MNTRAQIIGQVFIFILAAIIFGLILIYGYSAITKIMSQGEAIALATFQNDIITAVENIKQDYGSVHKLDLTMPAGYTELCFVDPTNPGNLHQDNPRIYTSWETGSENIFLKPPAPQPILVKEITVPKGYFCITKTKRITLRLEGLGDKAQITHWTPE